MRILTLCMLFLLLCNHSYSQQNFYDVNVGAGNGIRLWSDNQYKIHMGNSAEYKYGPVTDYSIKVNMGNEAGRGWTWGIVGAVPVAALNNVGNMQIAGSFLTGGNIGIATLNPAAKLDVAAFIPDGALGTVLGRLSEGNSTGSGTFLGVRGYATQQDVYSGKSFALEHSFFGIVNSSINFFRGADQRGGFITFNTHENIERMRLTPSGNLLIGKTSQANGSYKFDVNGSVRANEVVVNVTGADFVFDPSYNLKPLEEVEKFIAANKHLPDIQPANEMEKNGLEVGKMEMKLLQKVEELTLYMIALRKEIEELKEQNEKLKR